MGTPTSSQKKLLQKKRTIRRILSALLVCAAAGAAVLGVQFLKKSRQIIPYINDGGADWSEVRTVELYGDGCALPPTVTLDDPEQAEKLVKEIQEARDYIKVPSGQWLEGTNDIWVRFDNGVVIGMYRMENYGYIGTDISVTGHEPFYHFPESLRETVLELLAEEERKVHIFQGESKLTPYENFRFGQTYSKDGWVIGDGPFAHSILEDIAGDLPEAVAGADLEIRIPESANIQLWGIELFDQSFERMMIFDTKEEFEGYCDEMEAGIYYVSISIIKYGDYIESEEQNERFGYEYIFRLRKDNVESMTDVVENFFAAFESSDYAAMKNYCTEECVESYFHDGDVNGMVWAKLTECGEKETADNQFSYIFVNVEMETAKTSALYPETETAFYVELVQNDSGSWLINAFPTGR